ncbi:MAG TPA: prepilin-type N-terminal cleavage/methylation domain-containing protein [Tepidisphaeraceae bacterium]|jgi:hypothetical protein|nr:prepilin-type N-terminal cleavage/methylation domain-containing protein [Tepidisphaeraceae bacterium]
MKQLNMNISPNLISPPAPTAWRRRRHGFSFTEILFAVMILGIGFIMVAAMFPVAIKQTQESIDETAAADMAKEAGGILALLGNDSSTPAPGVTSGTFPETNGIVFSNSSPVNGWLKFSDPKAPTNVPPFWNLCASNLISPNDARYAWVPFYSRGFTNGQLSSFAQAIIIPVLDRNTANFVGPNPNNANLTSGTLAYDLNGMTPPGGVPGVGAAASFANLQGRMVGAVFYPGTSPQPDVVFITGDPGPHTTLSPPAPQQSPGAAAFCSAPGAYLIVADDSDLMNSVSTLKLPSCNGYIYQLGNLAHDNNGVYFSTTTFFLSPGNDTKNARYLPVKYTGSPAAPATYVDSQGKLHPSPPPPPPPLPANPVLIRCYIVGRGFNNPNVNDSNPAGPAMDISAFTSFFRVKGP